MSISCSFFSAFKLPLPLLASLLPFVIGRSKRTTKRKRKLTRYWIATKPSFKWLIIDQSNGLDSWRVWHLCHFVRLSSVPYGKCVTFQPCCYNRIGNCCLQFYRHHWRRDYARFDGDWHLCGDGRRKHARRYFWHRLFSADFGPLCRLSSCHACFLFPLHPKPRKVSVKITQFSTHDRLTK